MSRASAVGVLTVLACVVLTAPGASLGSARADAGRTGSSAGRLLAGAATVVLAVPAGTPLAGYGSVARRLLPPDVLGRHPHAFWFKPHVGVRDPLTARALVLEGHGRRIVWLAVELIAVDQTLTDEVSRRLGLDGTRDALIISASHTHSGPGGFVDSALMAFVAVDRHVPEVREAIVSALVDVAHRAERAKRSARLGTVSLTGPDVVAPRLDEPPDRELVVVKIAGDDGRPIALVWQFAIHGTMLGPRNLELSGDVMGRAGRLLEEAVGVPALYVNGAVGDVSPRAHGEEATSEVAARLAAAVESAWRQVATPPAPAPAFARETVALGRPALAVRNCVGRWWPRALELPLGQVFRSSASLVAVTVGGTAWVTIPGELQSALGLEIKRAARSRFRHTFVAGLSNDYLGYFVRAADWDRESYVTCASLFGADAGERLTAAASALLERLGRAGGGAGPARRSRPGSRR